MKTHGNLDSYSMMYYRNLVREKRQDEYGSSGNIIFPEGTGNAIKYTHDHGISMHKMFDEDTKIIIEKEYRIGKDLEENGINCPTMKALYIDSDKDSFYVMKKIQIEHNPTLMGENAVKRIRETEDRVQELGYLPLDLSNNWAWDKEKNDVCIFDFEAWEGPRVEEIFRRELK